MNLLDDDYLQSLTDYLVVNRKLTYDGFDG